MLSTLAQRPRDLLISGRATYDALGATRAQIAGDIAGSLHQRDGVFTNLEPSRQVENGGSAAREMARRGRTGSPRRPIPLEAVAFPADVAELAVTWLGHATAVLEIDGVRIITDPVFSRRCSPSPIIGPARMHPVPITIAALPDIDVVLISHDHYDHLDTPSVIELAARFPAAKFVTPIGVGAHLRRWGIAADRILQADWGGRVTVGDIAFNACSARHFSGRGLRRNLTLWASWAIAGPRHNAFFTGDTGYTDAYIEHGAEHGPFHLTLVPIGAYSPMWPDIHTNPEEALRIHAALSGGRPEDSVMLPIHWATFNLALHEWDDPVRRLRESAGDLTVFTPKPGGRIDVVSRSGSGTTDQQWWEAVG